MHILTEQTLGLTHHQYKGPDIRNLEALSLRLCHSGPIDLFTKARKSM